MKIACYKKNKFMSDCPQIINEIRNSFKFPPADVKQCGSENFLCNLAGNFGITHCVVMQTRNSLFH